MSFQKVINNPNLSEEEKLRLHLAAVERGRRGGSAKKKERQKENIENIDIIETFASAGLTDYQFALCLRLSEGKWRRMKGLPEVAEALKIGQSRAKEKVERALFRRAIGYTIEEVTQEERLTKDGDKVPLIKRVVRDLAPEPIAAMMWLSNKFPEEWKNRQDIESRGSLRTDVQGMPTTMAGLAELTKKVKEQLEKQATRPSTALKPEQAG